MPGYSWSRVLVYGALAVLYTAGVAILTMSVNSLSCISAPKKIEGEPPICEKSSQWAYLAITSKSGKFPESVSTSGVFSCIDLLKTQTCIEERQKYVTEAIDLLTEEEKKEIFANCEKDKKKEKATRIEDKDKEEINKDVKEEKCENQLFDIDKLVDPEKSYQKSLIINRANRIYRDCLGDMKR